MLKPSLIADKIKIHEKKLEEIMVGNYPNFFASPADVNEMSYHRFTIGCLERQERARIDSLPLANAGQILHKEYKRDWTEEELKEFRQKEVKC